MKDLTFGTMIAVFEEMFAPWLFWGMVLLALLITVAWLYVLVRDRAFGMRQFLIAQLFMPIGAIAAVWFVMGMTDSHLADVGGPVDVIVLLAIAALGAIGMGMLVYVIERLGFRGHQSS